MKSILLKEYIQYLVKEVLRKFDVSTFERYTNLTDMLLYARYHLPSLGAGSSREAFAYSGNKVLKMALNQKGLDQNTEEKNIFYTQGTAPAIAKIYGYKELDGKVYWLISEIGRPLANESEFEKLMGFNFGTYENLIHNYSRTGGDLNKAIENVITSAGINQNIGAPTKAKKIQATVRPRQTGDNMMSELKKIKNSPFVQGIFVAMKKNKLLYADLSEVDHYGLTTSGNVVLLDAGYTEPVWRTHYSAKQQTEDEPTERGIPQDTVLKPKPQLLSREDLPPTAPRKKK